ncbi:MAG: putative SOS response-associated peptidase YedK [Acidimicrobiales bacterium]|nr:MAG: SOS response-associated peptidase [Actinomycetota bacterium]MBV6507184.1 putative SOS response-associated peptidase YedK [Acidimicrobiales bacterium]RIK05525.1 MAG: hypothetical protein DCC48_09535 [Acidobacteriota bacterium]
MCGRFVSSSPPDEIAKYFDVAEVAETYLEPSYNVAPSQEVYAVFERDAVRQLQPFRWGLIPFWAKERSVGYKMINARAETLADKNAYKRAFRSRRCIIPANGFYEWKRIPGRRAKQPFYIHRPDDEPYAFAGLWEVWRGAGEGEGGEVDDVGPVSSCTIVTCAANDALEAVHDRMPVILPRRAWDEWLSEEVDDVSRLGKLLVPAPSDLTVLYPVSTAVNNPRSAGARLIDRLQDGQVED